MACSAATCCRASSSHGPSSFRASSSQGLSTFRLLAAATSNRRPARISLIFPSVAYPRLSSRTPAASPEPPPLDDAAADDDDRIGFQIQVSKLGKRNRRLVRARVRVDAPLEAVWATLTDYEGLADFIPSLSECRLLDQGDGFARLYQVGEQDLALGFKFNAKGTIECYEGDMEEPLPAAGARRREIAFNMIEGDFKVFQGKWSVEEEVVAAPGGVVVVKGAAAAEDDPEQQQKQQQEQLQTTLSYLVELEPKLWVPVRLLEGRICSEIKNNLVAIREQAQQRLVF